MRQKLVYIVLGIALVVGLITIPPAPVALAASGPRLQMYASCMGNGVNVSWLKVTGTNEYGRMVVWPNSSGSTYSPPAQEVITWGWYWNGNVAISYRLSNGRSGTTYDTVKPLPTGMNWYKPLPC